LNRRDELVFREPHLDWDGSLVRPIRIVEDESTGNVAGRWLVPE
jgi:hypothetical protein